MRWRPAEVAAARPLLRHREIYAEGRLSPLLPPAAASPPPEQRMLRVKVGHGGGGGGKPPRELRPARARSAADAAGRAPAGREISPWRGGAEERGRPRRSTAASRGPTPLPAKSTAGRREQAREREASSSAAALALARACWSSSSPLPGPAPAAATTCPEIERMGLLCGAR
ncbi:unnamed protein product [Urochloa humidicola]